ncbi:hypothetical protein GCM10022222_22560 [Amycolatopsis ultiminotia]|uniref:Uncharacterized protein n=1 Tax=Amycolatopsis ultiminotia TaxID=543629 RepID=A0ABP6VR57_9PSEU
MRTRIHRHAVGPGDEFRLVHGDDARAHRRGRRVDRQYQHGVPAYDQDFRNSLPGRTGGPRPGPIANPLTV